MRPKPFPPAWLVAAGFAISSGLPVARAATLYWDGTSTGPNADGGNGTWSPGQGPANWDSAATGGSNFNWFEGSDVVFGGTAGTVTISGTVSPASLDFRTTGYHVTGGVISFGSGTPVIATGSVDARISSNINGSAPVSKTGTGTLTLSAANSIYSGVITISQGTVKADGAGALGSASGATIITEAGALDLNGRNIGNEPLRIQGAGAGGKGTLVNNHQADTATIRSLQLTGAATIGGTTRWEIAPTASFFMGGRVLTKVGSGSVYLLNGNITSPGHLDIKEGSFWLENTNGISGSSSNTVTVRGGATLGLAGSSFIQPAHPWTAILEDGAKWSAASGPSFRNRASWTGPVTLAGSATLDVEHSFTMTHQGSISGTGSFTKTGEGTWILTSHNDYTGGTIVNEGKLVLEPDHYHSDAPPLVGAVTVNAGAILQLAMPDSLGVEGSPGVTSLTINGGVVESTGSFSNDIESLQLTAGILRADDFGSFNMRPGTSIQTYSAEAPSIISGQLYLGTSSTPLPFQIGGGNTTADLIVNATISYQVPGRGITKSGEGRMVLNGPSFFTGPTDVQAGTLILGVEGTLPASPVTVHTGGRFGTLSPGKTLGSLHAQGGSRLVLPASAGTTTTLTGDLDLAAGNITIAPVLGATSATGTYDLVTAASITGSGTPVLNMAGAYGATRATGSVSVVGNKLQLHLTGTGAELVWNNASAGGAAAGTWGTLFADFSLDGNNTTFQAFDSVTFDDSVAPGSPKTISLGTNLAPARVTVNNSEGAYTFTSSGGLVGGGSLVKTGTSSLVIGGADSYAMTGGVTAGGGLLDFSGKHISIGNLTVADGGELANATVQSQTMNLRSGTVTATLTGGGSWQKTTAGTVRLGADNPLTGPGLVAEGTLIVGHQDGANPFGSIGVGTVEIAAGATVTIRRNNDYVGIGSSFSGSGTLGLTGGFTGGSRFLLTSDNSGFSGTLDLHDACLTFDSATSVGTGGINVTGTGSINVGGRVVDNPIRLAVGSPGVNLYHLALTKATLTGPIQLAPGTTSVIRSYGPGTGGASFENHITGAITGSGGPASVVIEPDPSYGPSALVLSGASHYTGTTVIRGTGGVVKLDGSLGGSAVTVESSSALGGTGTIHAGGSLAFAAGGGLQANLSGDPLRVEGDVNLGSGMRVRLDVAQPAVSPGPFPILEYTGVLSGDIAQVAMAEPSLYRQVVFNFTPGLITLDIGRKTLVWQGAPDQVWEGGGTVRRWKDADSGDDEFFHKGDGVVFNDSGSSSVISSVFQEPASVLFDNSVNNLVFDAWIMGPCPVIKRGSGTVVLRSTNHHTGGTTVEAGTLDARTGSLGSGPVVVSAGGTLAGDTTFPGPLTVLGTLDPGTSASTNAATLAAGSTVLSGTYRCQLARYGCDRLEVKGDLDITGAALSVDRTYEVIDDPLDYFTLATWTGNLTGTFASVSGMPEGFEVVYDTPNKRIIAKPLGFGRWTDGYPGLSDTSPGGDPDHDGLANLLEYVLGGNPGSGGDVSTFQSHELTEDTFTFSYKRSDSSRFNTSQIVQFGPSLDGPWDEVPVTSATSSGITVVPNGDLPDDITVTLPRQPGQMFARLKVIAK